MKMKSTDIKRFISSIVFLCSLILGVSLIIPASGFSQESVVSASVNHQINPSMTTDNAGGTIITWQDFRNGKYEIFAQRMSFAGAEMWTTNGIPICTQDSNYNPVIIYDGIGGAIIVWQSYRNSATADLYAQHVNAAGEVQWTLDGVSLCEVVFDQNSIAMVSDDAGGAILTWQDYRSNNGFADIYAQRVSLLGIMLWTANGVSVCNQAGEQQGPRLISDGLGGAFVTWYDYRPGNFDIYTQRLGPGGAALWTTNGVATCTMATDQMKPDICSDGAGGVIITWYDFRSTTDFNIYAQRQGPAGGIIWTVDGIVMNNNVAYAQTDPKIISDGLGGAIISWTDFRTGIYSDIYAQRVNATGAVQWTATGVTICTAVNDQITSELVSDGNNGAYITWEDHRNAGNSDIYVQQIASNAALNWSADGSAVCDLANDQANPSIVSNGASGVIVVWQDFRSGDSFDIYAHGFDTSLPVELSSFTSVINASNVKLNWSTVNEQNNSGFDIERKLTNNEWTRVGNLTGNGTSTVTNNYSFEERNLATGNYNYRLKQIDFNGNFEYFNLANEVIIGVPGKFELSQNYPNPFNPTTKINYQLANNSFVSLSVYDISGRQVSNLVNTLQPAGYYSVNFSGMNLSSGMYFYILKTNEFTATKKMMLLK